MKVYTLYDLMDKNIGLDYLYRPTSRPDPKLRDDVQNKEGPTGADCKSNHPFTYSSGWIWNTQGQTVQDANTLHL